MNELNNSALLMGVEASGPETDKSLKNELGGGKSDASSLMYAVRMETP